MGYRPRVFKWQKSKRRHGSSGRTLHDSIVDGHKVVSEFELLGMVVARWRSQSGCAGSVTQSFRPMATGAIDLEETFAFVGKAVVFGQGLLIHHGGGGSSFGRGRSDTCGFFSGAEIPHEDIDNNQRRRNQRDHVIDEIRFRLWSAHSQNLQFALSKM